MLMLNNNRGSVEGWGKVGGAGAVKGQQVPSCRQHKYKFKYKCKYKHMPSPDNNNNNNSPESRMCRK